LRASLLDAQGAVLEHKSAPGGVMKVPAGQFSASLLALCGPWLAAHEVAVIASGMVGSRQGWKEAPYLPCPARLYEAAHALTRVEIEGASGACVHIVPGLRCQDASGQADVMRGEETQLWGAHLPAHSVCVLPGTHSKWAWLGDDGQVRAFKTYMTGELFGLLTQHGILGRLMTFVPGAPLDRAAFDAGVALGRKGHADLAHTLFAARTAGLMGQWEAQRLPDFLSGILLGSEIASALVGSPLKAVSLLGDEPLCQRYAAALGQFGIDCQSVAEEATTRGQWLIARAAGLCA
jgi:2-dehydro-3-deoxygalactonokinase